MINLLLYNNLIVSVNVSVHEDVTYLIGLYSLYCYV